MVSATEVLSLCFYLILMLIVTCGRSVVTISLSLESPASSGPRVIQPPLPVLSLLFLSSHPSLAPSGFLSVLQIYLVCPAPEWLLPLPTSNLGSNVIFAKRPTLTIPQLPVSSPSSCLFSYTLTIANML